MKYAAVFALLLVSATAFNTPQFATRAVGKAPATKAVKKAATKAVKKTATKVKKVKKVVRSLEQNKILWYNSMHCNRTQCNEARCSTV